MKREKIVEKGYDKIVEEYYSSRHIFDNSQELGKFVSLLPKNAKVLDVGCGAGVPVSKFLVEAGFDVVGVDFSDNMLNLARKNVPQAQFIKKDMTELDFELNSFDGIVATYSIIHVPREKHFSLFQSFHQILRSNGIMLISLGSSDWEGTDKFHGTEMFWSHYSPKQSLQIIKNSGFQVIFDKYIEGGGEKHYWVLAKKKLASNN